MISNTIEMTIRRYRIETTFNTNDSRYMTAMPDLLGFSAAQEAIRS